MNRPPAPPSTPSDKPARRPVAFSQPFDLSGLPERSLPKINGHSRHDAPVAAPGIDLAGRPKVWFVIGRGRIGKTTLIRWAAETLAARGGAECVYAAADPVNRSLKTFLREVEVSEPPTDDPDEVALWLQGLLGFAMSDNGTSALVDLGGGDTSLSRLLRTMPDLSTVMDKSPVAPVAIHVVGTDEHDLVPLAAMEEAGFAPKATAIVFNEMTGTRPEFARVMQHSVVQAALRRGAVPIWMPKLAPAVVRAVDARGLHFTKAADELGWLEGAPVRVWLQQMARQFEPISTWLP
jgi:hypothetical protein